MMGYSPPVNGDNPICPQRATARTCGAMRIRSDWRTRLEDLVDKRGGNKKALSTGAGLNETYLRDIIKKNQTPKLPNAERISRVLDADVTDWLIEPGTEIELADIADKIVEIGGHEYARLPVHPIRFAAGSGAVNYEEVPEEYYILSLSLLRSMTSSPLESLGVFKVDGDSMEPTLYDRDWILVDRRRINLSSPGIYALNHNGEAIIKRASQHLETGVVTLTSDNSKYDPQQIKRPDRLIVIGRMILSIRRH